VKCPHCSLENPAAALRCDCGYDFATGKMAASYLDGADATRRPALRSSQAGTRVALLMLLGFAGVLVLVSRDVLDFPGAGMLVFVPAMVISLGFQAVGLGDAGQIFVEVRDGFPVLTAIGIFTVYVAPPILLFRALRRHESRR